VVVGTIVLFVLARARMGRGTSGTPLPLLGGGLVAIAVADSGFVYLTASGSYSSGALIDAGWFLGYLLILLAARKPEDKEVDEEEASTSVDRMGLFLPYIAVVGAVVVSTVAHLQQGTPRLVRRLVPLVHHPRPGRPPGPQPAREPLAGPPPGGRVWSSGRPSCGPASSASRRWSSTAPRS
jgi:hypothetical protein